MSCNFQKVTDKLHLLWVDPLGVDFIAIEKLAKHIAEITNKQRQFQKYAHRGLMIDIDFSVE